MKKSMVTALIGLAAGFCFVNGAQADERAWAWSPLGIGIAAPLQLPFMDSDIYGIRLGGFLGYNNDVYGIDAGVVEISTGDVIGLQAAGFTWTSGDAIGLQVGAVANVVFGDFYGLDASFSAMSTVGR